MEKAIFSRIHRFQHTSYADIEGMLKMAMRGCPLLEVCYPTRTRGSRNTVADNTEIFYAHTYQRSHTNSTETFISKIASTGY